jgi:hypothetical protein
VDSLRIHLVGNEWVKEWTLLRTTRHKREPLVIWTDTSGETSLGMIKLEEGIEKPCSDVLAHTRKCVKVFRWINGYLATKNNHDSWGMCTTSAECRTIMTVVLTVISGMDPPTIGGTWVGMDGSWESVCLVI